MASLPRFLNAIKISKPFIPVHRTGYSGESFIKITPVTSDYFKEEYFAERPPCERLVNRKLDLRSLNIMRDLKTALKEYIRNYYKEYLE